MFQDWGGADIQSGSGGSVGRGGDVGSHNSTSNSHNTTTTTNHFHGPQFIVNIDGKALDITRSSEIVSHPFHGGNNQQWTLVDDGTGKFALKSVYDQSFVSVQGRQQNVKLVSTHAPFYFAVSQDGGGSFKLIDPNTGLAMGLGDAASLLPPDDQRTQVYVLEDTPENREAIKQGRIATSKATSDRSDNSVRNWNPVINLNITINDFSGSISEHVQTAFQQLQTLLASDSSRNLVMFFGQPQAGGAGASSNPSAAGTNPNEPAPAPIPEWNRFRIDSNYTLILGNGHNSDWDHLYVATSGLGYYGRVEDAEGPFHRSRVRNVGNLVHVKEIELRSKGPIFANSPPGVEFSMIS